MRADKKKKVLFVQEFLVDKVHHAMRQWRKDMKFFSPGPFTELERNYEGKCSRRNTVPFYLILRCFNPIGTGLSKSCYILKVRGFIS